MHLRHYCTLMPLVIAGCASVNTPKPTSSPVTALVFIDGQISQATDNIAHTQQTVRRTSPTVSPIITAPPTGVSTSSPPITRPVSPVPPSVSSPAADAVPLRHFQAIRSLGTPAPFVITDSRPLQNLTLEQAVRRIVPADMQLVWSPTLDTPRKTKVSLAQNNDQWPFVLDRLATQQQLAILVDWDKKQVSVAYQTPAFSINPSGGSTAMPQPVLIKTTAQPAGMPPTKPVTATTAPTSPRSPFSHSRTVENKTVPATSSGKSVASTPPVPKVVPVPKIWHIDAGSTLKDTLFN